MDPKAREESIIQRAVAMASTPDKVPDRILAAIAKDFFQPDKLALLQEALDKGKHTKFCFFYQIKLGFFLIIRIPQKGLIIN